MVGERPPFPRGQFNAIDLGVQSRNVKMVFIIICNLERAMNNKNDFFSLAKSFGFLNNVLIIVKASDN